MHKSIFIVHSVHGKGHYKYYIPILSVKIDSLLTFLYGYSLSCLCLSIRMVCQFCRAHTHWTFQYGLQRGGGDKGLGIEY